MLLDTLNPGSASSQSVLLSELTAESLTQILREMLQKPTAGELCFSSEAGPIGWVRFSMGRLTGGRTESHRWRRLYRLVQKYCPDFDASISQNFVSSEELWAEIEFLTGLVRQQRLTQSQATELLETYLVESLFDLMQRGSEICQMTVATDVAPMGSDTISAPNGFALLNRVYQDWQSWSQAGLVRYSPEAAPVIRRPEDLQRLSSPQVYQTLVSLLTGRRSLRDLAAYTRQDLGLLTQTLAAYVEQGLIGLEMLEDLPGPVAVLSIPINSCALAASSQPLIMCIDDNPKVCEMMGKILRAAGYRYTSVLNSLDAIPMLLEHKPDLIFLDLVMPVASGYEVCSQIRRIGSCKDIPVVILTGNDGIIDRIRSRASGATDFMSKPPDVSKVLAVLKRYVRSSASS
jgi:two-component system, chemotaxis family, response regulator PixG